MRLHIIDFFNFFFLLYNLSNFFLIFFFLVHVIISILFNINNYTIKFLIIKNWILNYFYIITIFFLFLFFFKLYFYFLFNTTITLFFLNNINSYSVTVFGDILICLSILITLISWLFLSERFLYRHIFHILYFYIFIICTVGMVSSSNLLIMFIYFELLFLPSLYFVYQFGYSKKVNKTIMFLLTWTLTGSFICLLSFMYIFSIYKTLYFNNLLLLKFSLFEQIFLLIFFFIGFGIKIPVWPFYYWLTKVHVEAPTGFSIFLSGFLVKTALYCFMFTFVIFLNKTVLNIMLCISFLGVLDASIRMWGSLDIKRLIAFATVQEMNMILIMLLLLNNSSYSILNLFLLVHGILSGFLFFLVDQIQKRFNTRNLILISGASLYTPILFTFIWLSILIFRGFPVFIKFIIEWEFLHILYINFSIFGIFLFFLISMFGVLGFCRIWFTVIYGNCYKFFGVMDILKKDFLIGVVFLSFLLFLLLFSYIF